MVKEGAVHLVSNIGGVLAKEEVLTSTEAYVSCLLGFFFEAGFCGFSQGVSVIVLHNADLMSRLCSSRFDACAGWI